MDNAAEALRIAGGILIAIITISLLAFMIRNVSIKQNEQKSLEEVQRLAEWNAEWEAYNKRYLYGAEVLTVVKKAEQNNSDYINTKYHVIISIKDEFNNPITEDLKDYLQSKKTNIFECKNIGYDDDTGRVNKMEFKYKE